MAELIKEFKEFFKEQLKALASKDDLKPINETLSRTTAVVADLSVGLKEFREEMKNVPSILDSHTTTLDKILKNSEDWKTEAAALRSAIRRHEQMIAQMAHKLGMNFENE